MITSDLQLGSQSVKKKRENAGNEVGNVLFSAHISFGK